MEALPYSDYIKEKTGKVEGKGVKRGSGRSANLESRPRLYSQGYATRILWVVLLKSLKFNGMRSVTYKVDKLLTYLEYFINVVSKDK